MNFKQASYIRTIVQEGSISAAARKLYISQPSLSQMVRQAESEYGVQLFDRSVFPLRLTFAGERYLEAANQILTVNERGDTIREVHFYHEREKTIVVDSTNRYQSKIDSLQSIVDRLSTKEVVKEPWFWDWGWKVIAVIAALAAIVVIARRRIR